MINLLEIEERIKEKIYKPIESIEVNIKSLDKNQEEGISIFGFSTYRLLAYFIIYSFLGCIIEMIFGLLTEGVIENRQSVLYGPFCTIYGLGGVLMTIFLQYFKKNNHTIFIGAAVIGSAIEYIVSWIGEISLNVKWWDYTEYAFNINGRTCLIFSIFWGALGVYMVRVIQVQTDRFIDKMKSRISIKRLKKITVFIIIFLILDFYATSFALRMFFTRLENEYNLGIDGQTYFSFCNGLYDNEIISNFVNHHFSNEKMYKKFPNLTVNKKGGGIIYISDVFKDMKSYHFKVFDIKKDQK
jgi:uncharacterized membrane protein